MDASQLQRTIRPPTPPVPAVHGGPRLSPVPVPQGRYGMALHVEGIQDNNQRFMTAARNGDAREMASCYSQNAILLPPNHPSILGLEDIETFWRVGVDAGLRDVHLETLSLEVFGDAACEVGRATLAIHPGDGAVLTDEGKYVVLHKRQENGAWKWEVDIFNWDSGNESAAPSAETRISRR